MMQTFRIEFWLWLDVTIRVGAELPAAVSLLQFPLVLLLFLFVKFGCLLSFQQQTSAKLCRPPASAAPPSCSQILS